MAGSVLTGLWKWATSWLERGQARFRERSSAQWGEQFPGASVSVTMHGGGGGGGHVHIYPESMAPVRPDDLAAAGRRPQAGVVPNDPANIPRWSSHAARMAASDLQVATYVHVRITEALVADLTQAVADLQAAIARVVNGIGPNASALQQALNDSQAANAALQAAYDKQLSDDAIEDADFQAQIADLQGKLDTANSQANDAAAALVAATAQLDQIGSAAGTLPPTDQPPAAPPATDESGNPITDDQGNPVDTEGNPLPEAPPGDLGGMDSGITPGQGSDPVVTAPGDPAFPMGEPPDPTGGEGTPAPADGGSEPAIDPITGAPVVSDGTAETPPADTTGDTTTAPDVPPADTTPADQPPATPDTGAVDQPPEGDQPQVNPV